jgi:release factor glutamine methyltransferase
MGSFLSTLKTNGLASAWRDLMAPLGLSSEQSRAELRLWCDHYSLGKPDTLLYLESPQTVFKKIQPLWPTWKRLLEKRIKDRTPIQYLLGEAWFMGERFIVRPPCLIPRPETELLVEAIVNHLTKKHPQKETPLTLWEVGCGSGAICLSVIQIIHKYNIRLYLTAGDICPEALKLTQDNADLHSISDIHIIESNLLDGFPKDKMPHVILANLPYIDPALATTMSPDVTKHEGHHTLFAEQQGHALINQLIAQSAERNAFTGILAIEFGEGMHTRIDETLTAHGFMHLHWITDYAGIIRHVLASKEPFAS